METLIKTSLLLGACFTYSVAYMNIQEFKQSTLHRCYAARIENQVAPQVINGQEMPLPSAIETFISIVEKYETNNPNRKPEDIILDLLVSFKCDDIAGSPPLGMSTRGAGTVSLMNKLIRIMYQRDTGPAKYAFKSDDFTEDEQCALHFMLSHSVNDTLRGDINEERITLNLKEYSKRPRESGVVSLNSKTKHALALGKVLLGIMMGMRGDSIVDATELMRKVDANSQPMEELATVKLNLLHAVTIGNIISMLIKENLDKGGQPCFTVNGLWNDAVCTTEYSLNEYSTCYATYSLIRGAVDGFILGKGLKKQTDLNKNLKLSQILRTYYGPYGFPTDVDLTWCRRKSVFGNFRTELESEVTNFDKVFKALSGSTWDDTTVATEVSNTLAYINSYDDIFKESSDEASLECSPSDSTGGRACETPSDIFSILDYGTTEVLRDLQYQVIGNLSVGFDIRESWSSMNVYTNLKPQQGPLLDIIVNNSKISGCPSCFAKYYVGRGSREPELEIMKDLNVTLGEFIEQQDIDDGTSPQDEPGTPAKVVLYFNYGNPTSNWDLRNSVWEIRRNYREVTILAVGTRKDNLEVFTANTNTDIFADSGDAGALANKLRDRICKVPAEFQYKDCQQSSRGSGTATYDGYITEKKVQYWAMYPKYFLKSFGIKLKFKALDGAQIKVCFSREYNRIIEDKAARAYCQDASGEDAEFSVSNPCYRRHEGNCDPFYFYIEGKKAPTTSCDTIRCKSTNQIRFEFSHEGIACSTGSYSSISPLSLLAVLLFSISFLKNHSH